MDDHNIILEKRLKALQDALIRHSGQPTVETNDPPRGPGTPQWTGSEMAVVVK